MKNRLLLYLLLCVSITAVAQNDYDTEKGIELFKQENYSSAVPYLQKAAKTGSMPALNFLGYMYAHGLGVDQDAQVAINLYKKGADKNDAPCIMSLGELYEEGIGVVKNPKTAYSYYKTAAAMEYGGGEFKVSLCKKFGFGTEQNLEEAFQYAEKAANHGWRYEHLADMYYEGCGTKVSYDKAYEWYTKTDCQYSDEARLRVAIMLGTGQGVIQNPAKALEILNGLKKDGSAVERLDEWFDKITIISDYMREDARLAAEWREREANKITTPVFEKAVNQYISNYPQPARPAIESAGRGEVVIACTVNSSGFVKNARIKYRVLQRLDNAALDLVKNMPRLIPGTRGGKPADIDIEIGVSFFPTKVKITKCYR